MRRGSVCVLRGRRNRLEACHCYRVVFSWGAALRDTLWWCIVQSRGRRSILRCGEDDALLNRSGGSFTRIILVGHGQFSASKREKEEVSHEMLVLEACYVKIERSHARNACFQFLLPGIWKKPCVE